MKYWIKKHRKWILAVAHLLVIPIILFFRCLSDNMLSTDRVCSWRRIGALCPTCGGTHFVYALSNGDLLAALKYNAFLFLLTVFFVLTLVFIDLAVWFDLSFPKKALKKMYSIPTLIILGVIMILFLILRNWRIWILLFQ
ncbi:MAG: DUF2752 domain-containing protein [Clostridia bacterium]|nr:DUF2752 domain-containing protein [Clostridia bacterium]